MTSPPVDDDLHQLQHGPLYRRRLAERRHSQLPSRRIHDLARITWLRTFDHQQVDGTSSTVRRVTGAMLPRIVSAGNPSSVKRSWGATVVEGRRWTEGLVERLRA